ncbi:MAG: sigma-70 family RNA polymerase sigma factor [Erythrobacter sp.]|uniref:sigma-70 family RNA polymerase sigma factor n=1 Tax=Erythrobacter sp. TaxID=1042 RepID=UPI003C7118F2
MKYDHAAFSPAPTARQPGTRGAYGCASRGEVEDRVRRFLPMVRRAAFHIYGAGRDGMEVEDLMQAGIVALTECAQRHEGPGEDGFAAYAKIRVRGAMMDLIRRQLADTRTARRKRAQYARAVERLQVAGDPHPTGAAIAAELGVSDAELREIEASAVTIGSIEDAYDETSTAFASEDPDPFAVLSADQDRQQLVSALGRLPERLQVVLQLFFVEELNLTEIAAVLEVSVPRVHQLRAKALKDLKALMETD